MRRALVVLVVAVVAACGATNSSTPGWRANHPDTATVTFVDNASAGLCAVHAQYPDEAPSVIDYLGKTYAQGAKSGATPPKGAVQVDHSGDWQIFDVDPTHLVLLEPSAAYAYAVANCS